MDNRRMCPNCRAFITTSDRACPYCGVQVGPRAIDRRDPAALIGGLIPARHFTTFLLLLINVAIFAAECWMSNSVQDIDGRVIAVLGGMLGSEVRGGDHQLWRLVTAGFLHGGALHILFNGWALYVLGIQVEEVFGASRFLVIFFASTVAGFSLSAFSGSPLSCGASAGIMGLIGAIVALGHTIGTAVGRQIRNQALGWLALNLVIGFMPGANIDNWAHIGGFLGGLGIAWFCGTPMRSTQMREAAWRIAGIACVLVTVACFWWMYRNFPSPQELHQIFQG